jgi:hypothetical protein
VRADLFWVKCYCKDCTYKADKFFDTAEEAVKNARALRYSHNDSVAVSHTARNLLTLRPGGATLRPPTDFYVDPPQDMLAAYETIKKAYEGTKVGGT